MKLCTCTVLTRMGSVLGNSPQQFEFNTSKQMDDEEYVVRNADTDEVLTLGEAAEKFTVMTVSEFPQAKADAKRANSQDEEEDEYYFDAKQVSLSLNQQAKGESLYAPPSIPPGGRLQFARITAVGNSHDGDNKSFSVYYLDVRCNIASPNSWFVYRRYSQFRRLSDVLRSEGYFVPILPKKKLLGSLQLDFIRTRKAELESWLHNLAQQYSVHGSNKDPQQHPYYRQFLTEGANRPPQPLVRVFPEHLDPSAMGEEKNDGKPQKLQKVNIDDFELIRVIGKGSFGKVTLVKKKSDQKLYAMKVLSKPNIIKRKQVEHTRTERRVLGTCNCPFIVKLHYAFQTDAKLYFVLDYCGGGELFYHLSRLKKFPENMARFYIAEISVGLEALHQLNVVYRDLKPENILLDSEGHIKLADFGLAKENVTDAVEGAHSLCGTPEYLSPEVLDRQGHGTAVDWWNLGMVSYEMLTGLPPWYTTDREKLFDRLRNAPLKFPFFVSRTAASLIQGLLNRNPALRLGAGGGKEVHQHPFFNCLDMEKLRRRELPPPFNPCRNLDESDSDNFEDEFTSMPVHSVDESKGSAYLAGNNNYSSNNNNYNNNNEYDDGEKFLNFTYEEESQFDSLREEHIHEKVGRRK